MNHNLQLQQNFNMASLPKEWIYSNKLSSVRRKNPGTPPLITVQPGSSGRVLRSTIFAAPGNPLTKLLNSKGVFDPKVIIPALLLMLPLCEARPTLSPSEARADQLNKSVQSIASSVNSLEVCAIIGTTILLMVCCCACLTGCVKGCAGGSDDDPAAEAARSAARAANSAAEAANSAARAANSAVEAAVSLIGSKGSPGQATPTLIVKDDADMQLVPITEIGSKGSPGQATPTLIVRDDADMQLVPVTEVPSQRENLVNAMSTAV